ncbi:MAG: DNA-binding protein [Duganella sp.]
MNTSDTDAPHRIMSAADTLFEQGGRSQFPTVDAVRKAARVSMNDASAVMKDWRRLQLAQRLPAPVQVPVALLDIHRSALEALWVAAQEQAGLNLAAMRTSWDAERAEAAQLSREMADAFELQSAELAQARESATSLQALLAQAQVATARSHETQEHMQAKAREAESRASMQSARAAEIERRADELRAELDRAHQAHGVLVQREAALLAELTAVRADMHSLVQIVAGATDDPPRAAKAYGKPKHQ